MKTNYNITISEVLGKNLNTREAVYEISRIIELQVCKIIELDFSDVEFMSRSFADQFHKEKIKLQNSLNIIIEIQNANEEIIRMLESVAINQNKNDREKINVPVLKFTKPELISDYLFSI